MIRLILMSAQPVVMTLVRLLSYIDGWKYIQVIVPEMNERGRNILKKSFFKRFEIIQLE